MAYRKALPQGGADGLCGLYCLLNFIVGLERFHGRSGREQAFYTLLKAAERVGVLDAAHIEGSESGGYAESELQQIFVTLCDAEKLGYTAVAFKHAKFKDEHTCLASLVANVAGEGGAIVMPVLNGAHWVLAFAERGGVIRVRDSRPVRPKKQIKRASFPVEGLILLPKSSRLLKKN